MANELDRELYQFAARQHSVFGIRDLDGIGFSRDQRARRLRSGTWVRLYDGVYRIAGSSPTWKGGLLAACIAAGPDSASSHRSAAALWVVEGGDRDLTEILCRRWGRAFESGLVVHETKALDPRDVTVVDAIPVTTIERTLLDLGAVRHPLTVERAVETALRKELTTLPDLRSTVRRLGARGRNGVGVLRRIIDERDPGRRLTESAMEMRLLQVLRAHGLPEPVTQHEIRDGTRLVARVDAAYPDLKIALEYESLDWHTGKTALLRDSARRNALVGIDWRPIAVTVDDLRTGGHQVCAQIRRTRSLAA